jgi:P27 family predicted phage terminase small subunit
MKGRKPKPTHLKLVRNNPGRRPLNPREPRAPIAEPVCPEHLNAKAREHWARTTAILRKMNILSVADADVIAAYCTAYARWVDAETKMATYGVVMKAPKSGVPMQSIFLSIANNALAQIDRLGEKLGLSPQARARLEVNGPQGSQSPASRYFDD